MFRPTRLVLTLQSFWGRMNNQIHTTNQMFAYHFLCLLCGFFLGNVFGVFLTRLRDWFTSDLLIVGLLLCFSEFISFQTYKGGREEAKRLTGDAPLANRFSNGESPHRRRSTGQQVQ